MSATEKQSAGILLFRVRGGRIEVLLAHPGGPFWAKKDVGAWGIPKGMPNAEEDLLAAAKREFQEEVGSVAEGEFVPLGSVQLKSGKVIHAWACQGDLDSTVTKSNHITVEWPRGTGRRITFPEVDRCEWFTLEAARTKLNPAQATFIDRLQDHLSKK
jgi:predicted NUDIX family NTP pyrophosphohydrolase